MKRIMSIIGAFALGGVCATSVYALPFDGPSVSISGAQYSFGGVGVTGDNLFRSAAGSNVVSIEIFNSGGSSVLIDNTATLVLSPIDFSGGALSGINGGFEIYDGPAGTGTLLLSGIFGQSELTISAAGPDFESSIINAFVVNDPSLIALLGGNSFHTPGEFSATLGDVTSSFVLGQKWSTGQNATGQVESTRVPEPTSLLLLGAGLAGIGIWRRMASKK